MTKQAKDMLDEEIDAVLDENEHLVVTNAQLENDVARAFVRGAQACREMLATFVECAGDPVTAASIRANWNPAWGADPGPP